MTKRRALVRHMAEGSRSPTSRLQPASRTARRDRQSKETKKNAASSPSPASASSSRQSARPASATNPQTGETIKIKAKTVVKFRVAKVAKDTIAPAKK